MRPDFRKIASSGERYNFHTHTEYCDGRSSIAELCADAHALGIRHLGFTPHCPVPIVSKCNMEREAFGEYSRQIEQMRERYGAKMEVYKSMEIDFLGSHWGPHSDYFQHLDLDYKLGSVHFVPNQDGVLIDCDGRFERFARNLKEGYRGDLRYVVEKFYEQTLLMLEEGGLDLLGHFDKIGKNASEAQPGIEEEGWYEALIDDVVSHAQSAEVAVEINTKYALEGRYFPHERWWKKLEGSRLVILADSDCHEKGKMESPEELKIEGDRVWKG